MKTLIILAAETKIIDAPFGYTIIQNLFEMFIRTADFCLIYNTLRSRITQNKNTISVNKYYLRTSL
jgi:hypothetical protein